MKSDQYSFKVLILSDINRKYESLPLNFPESNLKLFCMILIFIIGSKGFRSIFFYRLLSTKISNYLIFNYIFSFFRWVTFSVPIPRNAQIGPQFLIGHPEGIVINGNCIIGKNFTIQQGATLGGNMGKVINGREAPIIGDNVFIGPGAKVLGPVIIGDNSIIGANAVVVKDIPNDSVAVGIPAKIIKKAEESYIDIEKRYKKRMMENTY